MRQFLTTSTLVLSLILLAPISVAFADFGGTANGSSCDLNGLGSGGGLILNGTCVSPSAYTSQPNTNQVQSQPNTIAPNTSLINPLKGVDCSRGNGDCLSAFLLNIMDFVINIGSIVVILMLIFVGFKFVMAQGAPGEIENAKKMLLWTVIGALVLLGAKAISLGILATVQALGG